MDQPKVLGVRLPAEWITWYREKLLETYGTTYGYSSEIIMRSVENWFNDLTDQNSISAKQHHHIEEKFKPSRRHDVREKLVRLTRLLQDRSQITTLELASAIDGICGNNQLADKRTRQKYMELLVTGYRGISIRPTTQGHVKHGTIWEVRKRFSE